MNSVIDLPPFLPSKDRLQVNAPISIAAGDITDSHPTNTE
jgi:hypothetical protein